MFGVPLPDSVQQSLDIICQVKKQPQPDAGIRRKLASLTEKEALNVLEQIYNTKAEIRTLNGFISYMINKIDKESSSSSSCASSRTVLLPLSPSASSSSVNSPQRLYQSHDHSQGERIPCGFPVVEQQQDYNRQGEFSNPSPVTLGNGQSPSSLPSPYQILSAPSDTYRQLSERFQGICISPTSPASPVTPVQLPESFQGEASSVVEQPGNCNGQLGYNCSGSPLKAAHTCSIHSPSASVAHVHVDDQRFQGEAVGDRSHVVKQLHVCSYLRSCTHAQVDERSQGEASSVIGISPCSLLEAVDASPCQRLSAPVQGEAFTVLEQPGNDINGQSAYCSPLKVAHTCYSQSPSASLVPLQLDKRFQGDTFTDRSLVEQLPCSGSQCIADKGFQGEAFSDRSAVRQLADSFFSPSTAAVTSSYQRLSTPVQLNGRFQAASTSYRRPSAPLQLDESFQGGVFTDWTPVQGQSPYGVYISPYQRPSADVVPVQVHERLQVIDKPVDHGEAHLVALGELEFRRQFLILSYAGGEKLKDLIAAEDIRNWRSLPMVMFESKVWEQLGRRCINTEDRRLSFDWDSGSTHVYHCYVNVDGSYIFKGPYLYKIRRTLLQKKLADDNVLMVKFAEEEVQTRQNHHNYSTYMKVAREGILVGLRRYRFFVYKDGGNEEKKKNPTSSPVKCYFVRVGSDAAIDQGVPYPLSNKTMHEARCLFMHAHKLPSIAEYMARFSLILSKTTSLQVDWSLVTVEPIDEEYCLDESGNRIYRHKKPLIHTDGTGFISEDLAVLCPKIEAKGQIIYDEHMKGLPDPDEFEDKDMGKKRPVLRTEEPPLLIQCRLFHNGSASKGTLLVNKKLQPNRIQIRPSMLKVKTDPTISNNQTMNSSLEIVGTSTPPRNTHLSRILIALLIHGGVPEQFFMDILNKALEDAHVVFCKTRAALKAAEKYGEIDDNFLGKLMISFGIPLEESYLRYRLSVLMKEENNSLKKGRLYIPDSYYLMGTSDPTGTLKRDEICVILKDGQLSGKVLVYRYPGLHFGDIHVLKATYVKELESFVGNAKYGIFFSCKGPRSVADEMGGGDFDGDLYWVSRNPQLLEWYKPSEPWVEASVSAPKDPSRSPLDHSPEDLEDALFSSFLTTRFEPSFAMSEAADNWLARMDHFLTLGDTNSQEKNDVKDKILQLVDLYYTALDAPKKGGKVVVPKELKVSLFPHYMGKNKWYHSTSVLGSIYDTVCQYQTEDRSLKEVEKLPSFDVKEVPIACLDKWEKLHREYRNEMSSAMRDVNKQSKNQSADLVIRKYKEILYEANDFEESRRPIREIYNEAQAIYHVCYDHAKKVENVKACSFAWKVAEGELSKTTCEPSFAMPEAAQNWMVLMDQFLTLGDSTHSSIDEKNKLKTKILKLIDIYYESLDAHKKGYEVPVPKELKVQKFPHFMEKKPDYHSSSILGSIYDKVDEYE